VSYELRRTYRFEAAHWLPKVPESHPCHRLHGHSYEVDIEISGELDPQLGWVIDYGEIDDLASPLLMMLDHRCLNEIDGLENPTCELLARWIWTRMAPEFSDLVAVDLAAVVIRETKNSAVVYRGSV
jgi:6-pyruvoyltetrahydropterin/6-carboxytetrahydropterin synthase